MKNFKKALCALVATATIGIAGMSLENFLSSYGKSVNNVSVTGNITGTKWKTRSGKAVTLEKYTLLTDNLGEIEVLHVSGESKKPYFDILYEADKGDGYRIKSFFVKEGKVHAYIDDIEIINRR